MNKIIRKVISTPSAPKAIGPYRYVFLSAMYSYPLEIECKEPFASNISAGGCKVGVDF